MNLKPKINFDFYSPEEGTSSSKMSSSVIQKCEGCRNPIPRREHLQCALCNCFYDLACGNVEVKTFRLMSKKDDWKCPKCKCMQPKTGNTNTPIRDTICAPDHAIGPDNSGTVTHKRKGTPTVNLDLSTKISDRKEEIVEGQDKMEIQQLCNEIRAFRTDMNLLRATMQELHEHMREQTKRIEKIEARMDDIERNAKTVDSERVKSLEDTILEMKQELRNRDQDSLSNDIEIAGLPEMKNENATSVFITVAKKLALNIDERDIVTADRVGPIPATTEGGPQPRPRPLVIRVTRRALKDSIIQAARVRRRITTDGMALPGSARVLYVNERLTKHNRQLFRRAKEIANSKKWKYVWTRGGKIYAREEHGKTRYRICTETDLNKVFGDSNVRL